MSVALTNWNSCYWSFEWQTKNFLADIMKVNSESVTIFDSDCNMVSRQMTLTLRDASLDSNGGL